MKSISLEEVKQLKVFNKILLVKDRTVNDIFSDGKIRFDICAEIKQFGKYEDENYLIEL